MPRALGKSAGAGPKTRRPTGRGPRAIRIRIATFKWAWKSGRRKAPWLSEEPSGPLAELSDDGRLRPGSRRSDTEEPAPGADTYMIQRP